MATSNNFVLSWIIHDYIPQFLFFLNDMPKYITWNIQHMVCELWGRIRECNTLWIYFCVSLK